MALVAYNEELAERVREALADRTDVEEKKMFGGLTFMVGGQMCCGVLKNDLIVRIEPTESATLVAEPHVRPFASGRPMQGMVYVDVSALSDPEVPAGVHTARDRLRRRPSRDGETPQARLAGRQFRRTRRRLRRAVRARELGLGSDRRALEGLRENWPAPAVLRRGRAGLASFGRGK